ncbi:MAG TPA: GNAT family N-acetyltransferase [Anaerolineae bacterium]|nr:GNAT family N-acetyltransferase [Anaerolineae bacterium]
MTSIRRLIANDLPRLHNFWVEHWGDEVIVSHGNVYRPEQLEGFVVEDGNDWIGLLTFLIGEDEFEITSLNSLRENQGIGTTLLNEVLEEARKQNSKRVFCITTNDNLNALGFYQKRGFELVAVHRGAINESRRIKPGIPLLGYNNIPLRDEIELEMKLKI